MGHARFLAARAAMRCGRPVVLVDDMSDQLTTGTLVVAAQHADTRCIALLVRETSGFVCVAMTADRLDELGVPEQTPSRRRSGRGFAVTVDLRHGITTGISARDRALTIRALADPATRPDDLTRPGHVVPVSTADGGVLERPDMPEAAIDLCAAAGLHAVAAFATVLDADGEIAGLPRLSALAHRHAIPVLRVSEIVAWRAARRAA